MTPTFDAIVALWRAGLAAGDPAPRVQLSSLAVGQLQAELPGVPSSALAGLAGLPSSCVLRLDRNLPDGAVLDVRAAPAAEPADVAPAVHLGGQDDAPRPVQLPPFRWEDVLKAMPPPPPVRPAGIPHPLGPDPSPACATKESPTSANDVGPNLDQTPTERAGA